MEKMVSGENRNKKKSGKSDIPTKNGAIKEWILVLNRAHHGSNQPRLGLFRDKHFFLLWPDLIEILSTCKVQVGCINDHTCKNLESCQQYHNFV